MSFRLILRIVLCVLLIGTCTYAAALISTWFVVQQLAAKIRNSPPAAGASQGAELDPSVEIDFFKSTGMTRAELEEFLREAAAPGEVQSYPMLLTLQNDRRDYLAGGRVIIRWDGGEQRLLVGESAVIRFQLDPQKLAGLKVIAPPGFVNLRQRSIALGTAYDPEEEFDASALPYPVHLDGLTQSLISRGLVDLQTAGEVLGWDEFQQQLQREVATLELQPPENDTLTAEEIYQRRRDCVVILAHRYPNGQTTQASGVVVDRSGIIVTNYHAVNKPTAVSRGILTADGRMHAIKAVVAADRSADLALLKIDAAGLQAAPLAPGEPVGATVTIISHPNMRYYSCTQGHITRYWAATSYGRLRVWMGITADFADGSSGAPCFSEQGNVVGIVSSTKDMGYQMVHRIAVPSETIQGLIRSPTKTIERNAPE